MLHTDVKSCFHDLVECNLNYLTYYVTYIYTYRKKLNCREIDIHFKDFKLVKIHIYKILKIYVYFSIVKLFPKAVI